jgi:hypothetical protein
MLIKKLLGIIGMLRKFLAVATQNGLPMLQTRKQSTKEVSKLTLMARNNYNNDLKFSMARLTTLVLNQ